MRGIMEYWNNGKDKYITCNSILPSFQHSSITYFSVFKSI